MRWLSILILLFFNSAWAGTGADQLLFFNSANRTILPADAVTAQGLAIGASYSTVRALSKSYSGALYQLTRASDSTTINVGVVQPGGFANTATQTAFCANTTCTVTKIYDQSGNSNTLTPTGTGINGTIAPMSTLSGAFITINGTQYMGFNNPGSGSANSNTTFGYHTPLNSAGTNVPTGSSPETIYALFGGSQFNVNNADSCCFEFINGETSETDTGAGHLHGIGIQGVASGNGYYAGSGANPWVGTDVENCLTAANYCGTNPTSNALNTGAQAGFVTAITKCDCTTNMTFEQGLVGTALTTVYNGALPAGGWAPMAMEGAVGLGQGGDASNWGRGTFYEGMIVAGQTNSVTDSLIQANVNSIYGGATSYLIGQPNIQNNINLNGTENGSRFYNPSAGTLSAVCATMTIASGNIQTGVRADSAGSPGNLLASSSSSGTAVAAGNNCLPLSPPLTLAANTYYWLVNLATGGSSAVYYAGTADANVGYNSNSSSLTIPMQTSAPANTPGPYYVSAWGDVQP